MTSKFRGNFEERRKSPTVLVFQGFGLRIKNSPPVSWSFVLRSHPPLQLPLLHAGWPKKQVTTLFLFLFFFFFFSFSFSLFLFSFSFLFFLFQNCLLRCSLSVFRCLVVMFEWALKFLTCGAAHCCVVASLPTSTTRVDVSQLAAFPIPTNQWKFSV